MVLGESTNLPISGGTPSHQTIPKSKYKCLTKWASAFENDGHVLHVDKTIEGIVKAWEQCLVVIRY